MTDMIRFRSLAAVMAFVAMAALTTSPASAKHRHHHRSIHHYTVNTAVADANGGDARIVSHPAGCPGRAFCGCGASVRLFGRSVRELWLARAWFKFPRSAPAPQMAAVRSHHVMVLLSHVEGSTWMVYDANSGGHATRIHPRSIAGYTIVNPHAGKYAAL
jgi:hypothetical protein